MTLRQSMPLDAQDGATAGTAVNFVSRADEVFIGAPRYESRKDVMDREAVSAWPLKRQRPRNEKVGVHPASPAQIVVASGDGALRLNTAV